MQSFYELVKLSCSAVIQRMSRAGFDTCGTCGATIAKITLQYVTAIFIRASGSVRANHHTHPATNTFIVINDDLAGFGILTDCSGFAGEEAFRFVAVATIQGQIEIAAGLHFNTISGQRHFQNCAS